jgi:hypothetical protein
MKEKFLGSSSSATVYKIKINNAIDILDEKNI